MKAKRIRTRTGFTLIELLVVTAIIAMLISILLPALGQAKEQAKAARCVANVRSLMLATNMYLQDYNDCFPFQPRPGQGVCSWSYGGKTNSDYWRGQPGFYYEVQEHPMNSYLLGSMPEPDVRDSSGNIIRRTEVPVLKCPSDNHTWQRSFDSSEYPDGWPNSTYDEVGTSYHFNLACYMRGSYMGTVDVQKAGVSNMSRWIWYMGGWTTMVRDAMRDAMFKHPSTFATFWEDPMDWAISQSPLIQIMGTHRKWSKHSLGFLDGHAANMQIDTRRYCGPSWYALNPEWIPWPGQPKGDYWYTNIRWRHCNPVGSPYPTN